MSAHTVSLPRGAGAVKAVVLAGMIQITACARAPVEGASVPPPEAATPAQAFVDRSAEVMGTRIDARVPAGADGAAEVVFEVFREVDEWASEWREGSPLTAVNRAAGGAPVSAPPALLGLVSRGLEIGALTGGAFDITWAALWGVWDFRADPPALPDAAELAARLAKVDYRRVEIDREAGTLRLPEAGMLIGLGGIAKGYALDRAAQALRARGVHDFNLSAGGQVLAGGRVPTPDGGSRPWRVGVRDPRGGPQEIFASLEVEDASVSTSGDYEHYFILDGVRYHHVLDLHTGYPATGAVTATVLSEDATLADALSTTLMVTGPQGLSIIEGLDGVEALLVDPQGRVSCSSGMADRLATLHPPQQVSADITDPLAGCRRE